MIGRWTWFAALWPTLAWSAGRRWPRRRRPDLEDALHVTRSIDRPSRSDQLLQLVQLRQRPPTHYTVSYSIAQEALNDATHSVWRHRSTSPLEPEPWLDTAASVKFSEPNKSLRHVERYSARTEDPVHVLNARASELGIG